MAAYADAHVMRNPIITIDSVEYANQCTKARFVPDTPVQTLRTFDPAGTLQDIDSTTWTLELSGVQSWKTGGLAKALWDAKGTEITVTVQPKTGTGEDTMTATIIAMPTEFGGEQGQFRVFDATFPVVGEPTPDTAV